MKINILKIKQNFTFRIIDTILEIIPTEVLKIKFLMMIYIL